MTIMQMRCAVQGFYFAWRIANDIRTGLAHAAENQQGLDDARMTWERMAHVQYEVGFHMDNQHEPLIRKVDCIQIQVPDLDAGLAFYRDRLGHQLVWRTDSAVGLRLPDTDAEIVLQIERPGIEVNLMVASVDAAVARILDAGGTVVVPPFDIQIGRCVVVQDPWGTQLILLDTSKGLLITDADGNIIGNQVA